MWFLPHWLEKNTTKLLRLAPRDSCTAAALDQMLDGHFSLDQPRYAADAALTESNRSVADWKARYPSANGSHYGSYAYDAGKREADGYFRLPS